MDREKQLFFRKFGNKIKELRLSKHWTLEDMQDHGFSSQHYQKIEKGKKEVGLYTTHRIAKAFGVSLSKLLRGSV